MTKPVDQDMPSITPDKDQVESFRTTRTNVSPKTSKTIETSKVEPVKQSSSGSVVFNLILIMLLAGASYWFYQQDVKSSQMLAAAEQRILDLENQLSATGEEMGESTVAMKVRLETLSEKSEKLWIEMDKLWASAWRRNQTEIKNIRSDVKKINSFKDNSGKQLTTLNSSFSALNEKQIATEFSLDVLSEKIKSNEEIGIEFKNLSKQLSTIESKSSNRDTQQIELASSVSELDTLHKMLLERLEKLEAQLAKNQKSAAAQSTSQKSSTGQTP